MFLYGRSQSARIALHHLQHAPSPAHLATIPAKVHPPQHTSRHHTWEYTCHARCAESTRCQQAQARSSARHDDEKSNCCPENKQILKAQSRSKVTTVLHVQRRGLISSPRDPSPCQPLPSCACSRLRSKNACPSSQPHQFQKKPARPHQICQPPAPALLTPNFKY